MPLGGFAFAILAAVAWGATYTLEQRALEGFSTTTYLLVHALITLIVLSPIAFTTFNRASIPHAPPASQIAFLLGSICVGIVASFCVLSAIRSLGATQAALLEISYPFFVALFSALLFGEKLDLWHFIGGAMIFTGSALIVVKSNGAQAKLPILKSVEVSLEKRDALHSNEDLPQEERKAA